MEINTKVFCPHCFRDGREAPIVAIVTLVRTDPSTPIIYGPGGKDQWVQSVTSFCCSLCRTLFQEPPGMPHAAHEILETLRHQEHETKKKMDPALVRLIKEIATSTKIPKRRSKKLTSPKKK